MDEPRKISRFEVYRSAAAEYLPGPWVCFDREGHNAVTFHRSHGAAIKHVDRVLAAEHTAHAEPSA